MKNKRLIMIVSVLLALFCLIPSVAAYADFTPVERQYTSFEDGVGIVSEAQAESLRSYLDAIANKRSCEVAVAVVGSTEGKSIMSFSDDLYDYGGYGYGENDDGVLLVVDMGSRKYWLTTYGKAYKAFGAEDSYAFSYTKEAFEEDLHDGNYVSAFKKYADACDKAIEYYDSTGKSLKKPFAVFKWILIGLAVGFIIALIATGSMKAQLKSVQMQEAAQSYIKPGSMKLTQARDYFVYRTVTRTAIPRESSSGGGGHTSSSGRTHGGSGGSF